MNTKNKKIIRFSILLTIMLSFLAFIFYKSEPKYINNYDNKQIEKFDYVTIPKYTYENQNGVVLQVDTIRKQALIVVKGFMDNEFYNIVINDKSSYRIVGKGTFYHKINVWLGFNVMIITQIFIMIICAILFVTLSYDLWDILNKE